MATQEANLLLFIEPDKQNFTLSMIRYPDARFWQRDT